MSRIFRALFVSAVATGLAAAVLSVLNRRAPGRLPPPRPAPRTEGDLSDAETKMLLDELSAQL